MKLITTTSLALSLFTSIAAADNSTRADDLRLNTSKTAAQQYAVGEQEALVQERSTKYN
ncbi:hypothetical protein [Octadecabacter antarcticus]|uniref:hypothetical protein n=1 Tax=Octadecabacter antarcticus TaxID=1217908 RepID=UPI0016517AFB|nr:hypothetical protein [Octadecabacter antarcticus]